MKSCITNSITLEAPGSWLHLSAVFARFSVFLPVRQRRAPFLAKSTAVAAPIPELAPVKQNKDIWFKFD